MCTSLLVLLAIVKLGCKCLPDINALAYFNITPMVQNGEKFYDTDAKLRFQEI